MKKQAIRSLLVLLFVMSCTIVLAQDNITTNDPITAKCGDSIESEFTASHERHDYTINLNAGDKVQASVVPVGDALNTALYFYNPVAEKVLVISDAKGELDDGKVYHLNVEKSPRITSPRLSAQGQYIISVNNYNYIWYTLGTSGGNGLYTLFIGCTLRDGTVINPGAESSGSTDASPPSSNTPTLPVFSGVGFPGLAPVDFSSVAKIPMITGAPMAGAVTATGDETIGFTFDASAGDKVDLTFSRIQPGNLNLGLVVLSPDNKVVFQASLVTSESLTTRFTLPSAGTYTIGVFRIDLLPPDNPQPTAFQVQVTLNP